MAAMYLVGDAKLWWQKKYAEIEDVSCVINTWDILKRELKCQLFPENTAFNARKALLECKHSGSVREYCQAFFALMLDISDMSAVDRLFFFMEGLKPRASTELNRRRVNNLNEAIIAAESLSDYNSEHKDPLREGIQAGVMVARSQGVKRQTKVGAVKADGRQTLPPNRRVELGSKPSLMLAPAGLLVGNPEESLTGEKPKDMPPKKKGDVPGKGFMYVDIKVKAINSAAQPVTGISRSVLIKIGPYEGRTNFSVVIMYNFKLILGLEFLRDTKTTVMPCTNSLAMLGSKLCVIPTISPRAGEHFISALQLKKGLKRDETTYLAMLWTRWSVRKKTGLLQLLPVPKRPWESVSLDFITGLPKVEDLGTILVVVDQFSKYGSFIATPKYCSAEDTRQLFFKYVVKYWGMPQDIVSYRDSCFTGNFWTELFKLFGSQLSMSSSYHPESDGQTKRFNSMLEEYLRHFVSATQKNWVKLLDVA
ncbi:hypothetical protein RJ639_033015 [Escallonia herrerae]|uniref:Integrase catalytic domain-containing protein n=1 Tax=Escallonia herrerae TaxID=1293975 RepID=A0AA89BCT3_9ASTE|nr:hypothetical protein RJ639_033015 [Escallonia herrerae]